MVKEETEEIRIPATELTHDGRFLDTLFPLLGKCLVGYFRSIFLHDTNHITVRPDKMSQNRDRKNKEVRDYRVEKLSILGETFSATKSNHRMNYLLDRNVRDLSCWQLPQFMDLVL